MINGEKYLPRVPSEYQEVEYLQSSGTQYIDTNIIPTNNSQTKVQFEFQLTNITNGQYQSIGCNSNMNFTSSQTLLKFRSNAIEIAAFDTNWHICEMSKSTSSKLTIFDGEEYRTTTTTEATLHFLLFGMSLDDGRYYGRYKLKYFKCYDNNIIVRNMIPVRRLSDNVLGMYDTVNDVFYTNQGTDTFTAGSDVSPWHDTPITTRKLQNATDNVTTLPVDIYTDGTNATVGLKGNMSQTGTPSPTTPIQPQETGERTAQLFEDKIVACSIDANGNLIGNQSFDMYIAKVEQGVTYTASASITGGFYTTKPTIGSTSYNGQRMAYASPTVTAPITGYMTFRVNSGSNEPMFNEGSTALTYEPYGYKIPISSANTTTPVYLGEVETTRRIGKYVFKGTENWYDVSTNGVYYTNVVKDLANKNNYSPKCSHFKLIPQTTNANLTDGSFTSDNNVFFWFKETSITSLADWKAWLAQQYANGTPVCVWYVLATETTGIINEPLRKIGYADTVSGISIPTITGADSFDVETTLKPSEVDLTYHGWHDISPKQYENGAWN